MTEKCSTSSRTLAYFGTEAIILDDDIGVCTTENHAQTIGNTRHDGVRSLYVSRDRLSCKHQQLQLRRVLVYSRLEQREIITRIGYFNCCSIGHKYSVVSDFNRSSGFSFFAAVES